VAVHLHLYYADLSDEFIGYLKNFPKNFHLYITTTKEQLDEEAVKKFEKEFTNVKVVIHENQGRDVGGFVSFLEKVDLKEFDLVLKIQTKKSVSYDENEEFIKYISPRSSYPIVSRDLWRKYIMDSLVGSKKQVEKIFDIFSQKKSIGMVGTKGLRLDYVHTNFSEAKRVREICKRLNLINHIEFFSGTFFWIRADLLKPIQENYSIDDFVLTDKRKKSGFLEHGFERVFGSLVRSQGCVIEEVEFDD
jgi:lipopolysaccharide biosynthesis protein